MPGKAHGLLLDATFDDLHSRRNERNLTTAVDHAVDLDGLYTSQISMAKSEF